jgi:hypothetical protein
MLFDEYEIYFKSETGFLIFSQVQSKSENIIKILSHEWNRFHIHQQSIEFSVYYIFFAFRTCLFQIWKILEQLRSITSYQTHHVTISFVIFSVKITRCGDVEFYSKDKLQYFTVENVTNLNVLVTYFYYYLSAQTRCRHK